MAKREPTYIVSLKFPNGEPVDPNRYAFAPIQGFVSAFAEAVMEAQKFESNGSKSDGCT